ncbi:MAG: DUF2914 domain-containing protein [Pseudomonadota bacterium]
MIYKKSTLGILIFWFMTLAVFGVFGPGVPGSRAEDKLTLVSSVMCESVSNFLPVYPAVVFTISQGEIFCYTAFDPVPEQIHIYHKWYKRDTLISSARLTLNPPKWSSVSSMQLRDGDKGAWRVEIVDANNILVKTLRFSISD